MFEATRNQLTNIGNPFQGDAKRVLCVCAEGFLRSPTLANVLHKELGYNTRACGTASSFALVPITEALIYWSEEIIFVDTDCKVYLTPEVIEEIVNSGAEITNLNVPDTFNYGDDELEQILLQQYLMSD